MSIPFSVPQKSGKQHREKLHIKKCGFPGCKKNFMGTGKSRFCHEHRLRKYRKIIDADKIASRKAEEEAHNPNQILKHAYNNTIFLTMKCKLHGCENEFEIKIFPNVYVYPKYCPEHRNSWKRELFIKPREEIYSCHFSRKSVA